MIGNRLDLHRAALRLCTLLLLQPQRAGGR
jgi:hypothetical protein